MRPAEEETFTIQPYRCAFTLLPRHAFQAMPVGAVEAAGEIATGGQAQTSSGWPTSLLWTQFPTRLQLCSTRRAISLPRRWSREEAPRQ